MYGSFYGGKQGRSYRIVAHYDSIYDMVTAFQQGNQNTDVAFDEYVIIDTILRLNQKNNPENGIIYRRGYNFSEGFNAQATQNQDHTIHRSDYATDAAYQSAWEDFVTNPGGGAIYVGQVVGPQGESPSIQIVDWDTYAAAQGVPKGSVEVESSPGYEYDEQTGTATYKDTVTYGYVTLRDADGNVSAAYLAFDIPYTVFKFEAESGSPYVDTGLITEQSDSLGHNYYKHYKIQVPHGKQGQDVHELLIDEIIDEQEAPQYQLAYKTKNYDAATPVISEPIDIAPYKVISELDTSARAASANPNNSNYDHSLPSVLEWKYTYGSSSVISYPVIERVWKQSGNDSTSPVYGTNVGLLDAHLYVLFSTETMPRDLGLIKDVTRVWTQSAEDPAGTDINGNPLQVGWVYIQLKGDQRPTPLGAIKSVENIWTQATDSGDLVAEHVYAQLTGEVAPRDLGYIKRVTSVEKNATDKKFYTHFNIGEATEFPVTEVAEVQFRGDNLWIGYRNITSADISGIDPSLIDDSEQSTTGITYINYGGMVSGSHVLTNFATEAALKTAYPNGLGSGDTEGRAGWLVTVGPDINGDYEIYAYDYIRTLSGSETAADRWYAIQKMGSQSIQPNYSVLLSEASGGAPVETDTLNINGLWFVITS